MHTPSANSVRFQHFCVGTALRAYPTSPEPERSNTVIMIKIDWDNAIHSELGRAGSGAKVWQFILAFKVVQIEIALMNLHFIKPKKTASKTEFKNALTIA